MTMTLAPHHLESLRNGSGIPDALIEARGYRTVTTKAELLKLGFGERQAQVPGLLIPLWWAGQVVGHQFRPDEPRLDPKRPGTGKTIKYETPRGSGLILDCPPSMQEWVADIKTPLWITEGAKKADASAGQNLCCINLMGVWNWKSGSILPQWHDVPLKGRRVFIAYDSDMMSNPHVRHAAGELGRWLESRGTDVKFIIIPTEDGKKVGLDDYFAAGHKGSGLSGYQIDTLPTLAPLKKVDRQYEQTEMGCAHRLYDQYKDEFRWVQKFRKFIAWDGRRWVIDENGDASLMDMTRAVIKGLYAEASTIDDKDDRKAAMAYAMRMDNLKPMQHVIDLVKSMPGIPITPGDLDQHKDLLNVGNGTIDLRTGEMRDHSRGDLITKLIPIAYNPEAEYPNWEKFICETFVTADGQPDHDLVMYIYKVCGLLLSGHTTIKAFWFLWGSGDNGKSVFIRALQRVVGEYCMTARSASFTATKEDRGGAANGDIARLRGARFVAASELGDGKPLDEELIKVITGRDRITARFMFQEEFEFESNFKLLMTGNHKPRITGQDKAIWNRVKLVPFLNVVPKERQDPDIDDKLAPESEGILTWLLEGYQTFRTEGLVEPACVTELVQELREDSDVLGKFLGECTFEDVLGNIQSSKLYTVYQKWCEKEGINRPMSSTAFGRKLPERGIQKRRTELGVVWLGVGLVDLETRGDSWWSDR